MGPSVSTAENIETIMQEVKKEAEHGMSWKVAQLTQSLERVDPLQEDAAIFSWSIEEQIDVAKLQQSNLEALLDGLWQSFKILARPTAGDGNCGVQTTMCFLENAPLASVSAPSASDGDMRAIKRAHRQELSEMWRKVAADPVWQQIWSRFLRGRVDLRCWKEEVEEKHFTPERRQKKRRKSLPFTPDKDGGKLIADAPPEVLNVVVRLPDDPAADSSGKPKEGDQAKSKKRSGKRLEPAVRVKFEQEFQKFLAEKGLTYRCFNMAHQKAGCPMVCLGLEWNTDLQGFAELFWWVLELLARVCASLHWWFCWVQVRVQWSKINDLEIL